MFWRITGKLLLKALLPFLILIGALNYMQYTRGGDPFAMWKSIGHNMMASMKSSTSSTMSSIGDVQGDFQNLGGPASATKVYAWKDAKGMMHYSTSKPTGIDSQTQSYDPDANVVQRFIAPVKPKKEPKVVTAEAQVQAPATNGLSLPEGAAGLPQIEGLDLKQLDEILKARQEMLDKY